MELVNGVLGNRYMHSLRIYRLHKRTHIKQDKAQSTQEHTGVHTHTHMTQKRAQRAPTHIMKKRTPNAQQTPRAHKRVCKAHRAHRNTHQQAQSKHEHKEIHTEPSAHRMRITCQQKGKDTDSGCLFCCEQRMAPLRAVARDLLYLSPHAACMPRCSVACPLYADVTLHIR